MMMIMMMMMMVMMIKNVLCMIYLSITLFCHSEDEA